MMDLSDKGNEVIFFMDRSRKVGRIPNSVQAELEIPSEKLLKRLTSSRTIIGRSPNVDVIVKDKTVSEEHAAIGYFDGIFFILDLKSKNGTYVNDERVKERVLHDNDEIKLGTVALTFNVSGRLHEEATERWPDSKLSIGKILEIISGGASGKFDDPTRIVIDGDTRHTKRAPLMQIYFEIVSGPQKGKKFNFLQKEILIGRNRGDLALNDPDISKNHAEVSIFGPNQVFIKDLGSTNGTLVMDKKVDRQQLKSGDIITVGSTAMAVTFGGVVAHPEPIKDSFDAKTTRRNAGSKEMFLEVIEGKDKGKRVRLEIGEHILGRNPEGISLKDMDVSRNHARILVSENSKAILADIESTNGTFVNGKKIEETQLKKGDEIRIGNTVLKFC